MGIFNKKKQETNSPFSQDPQPISGGNLYETHITKETQDQINKFTLDQMMQSMRIPSELQPKVVSRIESQTLEPYWLLELQINYFVNTIKYEMEDRELHSLIKTMLRVAFKNGVAGLYKQGDTFTVVGINKINYRAGKIESYDITFVDPSSITFQSVDEYKRLASANIKDIENITSMKWGSAGLSAWITIWKMCLVQNELLAMINVDKYSYIKKFEHKVNDPSAAYKEVDDYFDPYKPYVKVHKTVDQHNRFRLSESAAVLQPNILVEYYKQVMGIYYVMFGRRTNNDFKKERSVTQEIGLTSDNYLVLEKDWIDEFKYFVYQMKNKFSIDIEVIENEAPEEDKDLNNAHFEGEEYNE